MWVYLLEILLLTLSLPVLTWVGDNTNLLSNGNILKMVSVNNAFIERFLNNIWQAF